MHKPTYFCLRGLNNVIVGWKEGLIDKKVGDSILVIVPPQLGYGKYEVKDIQSNEILVYNIKVLGIK
jgi:FKBP-type peptidyl-prolyl cis-trans isomerase